MNPSDLTALLQWIAILPKVISAGAEVFSQIKAVLSTNGIALSQGDLAALDFVIADAARRKAAAESEAKATS